MSGSYIERNSATANYEEGIRLYGGPTHNTVQDNTVTGNAVGIRLFTAEQPVGELHFEQIVAARHVLCTEY